MVRPSLRSGSVKKRKVKVAGSRKVVHYTRGRPGKHKCARCRGTLGGKPNMIVSKIRKIPKSAKVPERLYGGMLCPNCVDELVRYRARWEYKFGHPEYVMPELDRDLTLEKFLPKGWWKK